MNELTLHPPVVAKQIIQFIQKTVETSGLNHLVVGLSGGIDSSLSCSLAVQAVGGERIYPRILPCGNLHPQGKKHAEQLVEFLHIPSKNVAVIDIKPFISLFQEALMISNQVRLGNVMARVRMTILFDSAKKLNAMVLGTENKSEHLLGYYTRFGDEASDIEPIAHLYKTQVRQLGRFLQIPKEIIEAVPTAGLWDGQTDEGEFGFSYERADQVLYDYFEGKKTRAQIEEKYPSEEVEKVFDRLEKNRFKQNLPYSNRA